MYYAQTFKNKISYTYSDQLCNDNDLYSNINVYDVTMTYSAL